MGIAKNYDILNMHEPFSHIPSRFSLISIDGKVIYDSDEFSRTESLDNHLLRDEIQESLKSTEGFSIRKSITQKRVNAYFALKFSDLSGREYILRVSQNYKSTEDELRNILLLNISFFLLLNLLIHIAYKNYLKRDFLFKLDGIKNYLTQRTLSKNKEYSLDEEKWLVDFWHVAEAWQEENIKNLHELNREKNHLASVVSSVESAILLLDENFNIILRNNKLEYLFNPEGNNPVSAIKSLIIYNLVNKYSEGNIKDLINHEIYLDEYKKFYIVTIKTLEDNSLLILIKDITPLREFIDVQKKFISNISHELKTPLTNIKGYLIALEDAPSEMRRDFFATIYNNVNKLENIIQDFLSISKMESSNILNIQEVSVEKIYNDLKISLSSIIDKKNGIIVFEKSNDLDNVMEIDYDKLQMVIKNLVENGFIYNSDKNPKVTVSINQNSKNYIFKVSDNGIGIDKEKQDRIFERFYRIEEARTTNLAGTGLGLAIVQELVKKMHGSIEIQSNLGVGTIFTIEIPKN